VHEFFHDDEDYKKSVNICQKITNDRLPKYAEEDYIRPLQETRYIVNDLDHK